MGRAFVDSLSGEGIYSCLSCDASAEVTHLASRAALVSTAFRGVTGKAFLFDDELDTLTGSVVPLGEPAPLATAEEIETYKDSRSRSYVPFLPFSLFVLVQKDDGVVVVPPPGGAGVCGGSDREWMYESVGYNVCLLVLSAAEHSHPGPKASTWR